MKDKWLMIGVGATFLAFFLMVASMMSLSRHSAKNKELLTQIPATPQAPAPVAVEDFSLYKTIVGDDGREMIEIPEGPLRRAAKRETTMRPRNIKFTFPPITWINMKSPKLNMNGSSK